MECCCLHSGWVLPAQVNLSENTLTDLPRLVCPRCVLNLDELTMKINDDTVIQSLALHKLSMVTQEDQKFEVILGSIASCRPPWDI